MTLHQILFVEDDVLASASSCEFIRDRGLRALDAGCAASAAEIIDRRGYLSALVTDVDLGDGEDGFAVARRARAAYPGLPVIFVSGAPGARDAAQGVEGSVFIAKPCHPREIVEALLAMPSSRRVD